MNKKRTIIFLAVILITPLIVSGLTTIEILPIDTNNDWIGFWGGYLGAVFGGAITMFSLRETFKRNDIDLVNSEKERYCFELIEIISKYDEGISFIQRDIRDLMLNTPNAEQAQNMLRKCLSTNAEVRKISIKFEIYLGYGRERNIFSNIEELIKYIQEINFEVSKMTEIFDRNQNYGNAAEIARQKNLMDIVDKKREELILASQKFVAINMKKDKI